MGEIKLDNLIKALRCLASNTPEGDCYEEQYNFGRKGQRISCYGSPETMKCPYNQDTYGVCFEDGECSEWLSEAAELLEELRQYRQIGTLEECREVNRLREQMQWIPAKERMPEDRTAVIATVLHRKWICDHDLDESEQTIYPERYEVCTVYRDGDKYIKLDEGYTETIVVPVGKQDDDIAYPVEEVIAWMSSPEPYHPLKEGADRKPPEWEQRVMNTFLGSRQEKKTDKTGTAEKPEKERL